MSKPNLKVVSSDLPPRMIAAIANLAEAAKELNECVALLWTERVTNLKKQGSHDVRAAMDSIRFEVTKALRGDRVEER